MRNRRYRLILYILITLVFMTSLFFYSKNIYRIKTETSINIKTPDNLTDLVKEKDNWERILKEVSTFDFYRYLKSKYSDNYNQHTVGHIFGEMLFKKEGVSGIEVCDEAFFWGCHHGFVSMALVTNGKESIKNIFDACRELPETSYQQCIHGIGHGLIGLYGEIGLNKSLETCAKLDGNESCYTGIFMEYNFPTVAKDGVFENVVRTIDVDSYKPCDELIPKYQESCYYELPRLWERTYESNFVKIGDLCQKILGSSNRKACFRGVGEIASLITDHDLIKTKSLCEMMPSEYGKNICLASSAHGFANVPEKRNEIESLCKFVNLEYKSECPKN